MKQLGLQGVKRNQTRQLHSKKIRTIRYFLQARTNFGKSKKTHTEIDLVHSLRNRDEEAFNILIDRYHSSLVRLALVFVPNLAVAEEVVQETWMGVLQGIDRFEERSSLKTWIFCILTNRAKTRGTREKRYVAFADDFEAQRTQEETLSDNSDDRYTAGMQDNQQWNYSQNRDYKNPEKDLLSRECLAKIASAIETLPPIQQQVIILSDVEGNSSNDICEMLDISENNRRVILHRARRKVRKVVGKYLGENKNKRVPKALKPIESLSFLNADTVLN